MAEWDRDRNDPGREFGRDFSTERGGTPGRDRDRGAYPYGGTSSAYGTAGRDYGRDYGREYGQGRDFGRDFGRDYGRGRDFGGDVDRGDFGQDFGGEGYRGTGGYGAGWAGRPGEGGYEGRERPGLWQRVKRGLHIGKGPKGYRRSDQRIHEDVCDMLERDPEIDATDIEVVVAAGEVTLSGTVDDRWSKRRAEDIIEELPGVRDVHNQLKVGTRPSEPGSSTGDLSSSAGSTASGSLSSASTPSPLESGQAPVGSRPSSESSSSGRSTGARSTKLNR
jgi:hypothetical protein